MKISEKTRQALKQPLGKLKIDLRKVKELSKSHRIISVGDICTLALLAVGIKPHLAVFDYKAMRKEIDESLIGILKLNYRDPKKYENKAGTLSDRIINDAPKLIEEGGGVLIDGEDDLTALAFIQAAKDDDIIVYGQPNEGIVIVLPDKKTKEKVSFLLRRS